MLAYRRRRLVHEVSMQRRLAVVDLPFGQYGDEIIDVQINRIIAPSHRQEDRP
jgi:hypothetical protein